MRRLAPLLCVFRLKSASRSLAETDAPSTADALSVGVGVGVVAKYCYQIWTTIWLGCAIMRTAAELSSLIRMLHLNNSPPQ